MRQTIGQEFQRLTFINLWFRRGCAEEGGNKTQQKGGKDIN